MQNIYLDLNLKGKVDFNRKGNVTSGNSIKGIQERNLEENNSIRINRHVSSNHIIMDD